MIRYFITKETITITLIMIMITIISIGVFLRLCFGIDVWEIMKDILKIYTIHGIIFISMIHVK